MKKSALLQQDGQCASRAVDNSRGESGRIMGAAEAAGKPRKNGPRNLHRTPAFSPHVDKTKASKAQAVENPAAGWPSTHLSTCHSSVIEEIFCPSGHSSRSYPQGRDRWAVPGISSLSFCPQALQQHHPLFFSFYLRRMPMTDWLAPIFPYAKAFHVMAVISWMAAVSAWARAVSASPSS